MRQVLLRTQPVLRQQVLPDPEAHDALTGTRDLLPAVYTRVDGHENTVSVKSNPLQSNWCDENMSK